MNTTRVEAGYQPVHQEASEINTMRGGLLMESIGALAALAISIVGLAGAYSATMAAIATLVLGAAIWIEGGAFTASRRTSVSDEGMLTRTLQWSEGLSGEFLAGLSGIVLGILALLGVASLTLVAIAVLVFGAGFLFTSSSSVVSGSRPMFGLAGLILGLLALCGLNALTLVLVALTCLSASALLSGAVSSSRRFALKHAGS